MEISKEAIDERALDKAAREGYAVRCKTHGPRVLDQYASADIMKMQLDDARVIVSAYLAALPFLPTHPIAGEGKVKQLEWREEPIPPAWESLASTGVGLYCIPHGRDRFYLRFRDTIVLGDFPTLDAAKAAAQADFETRIRQ